MSVSTVTDNRQVVDDYLHWLEHRARRRPMTIKTYRHTLTHYLAWLDELGLSLSDVRFSDVEDFAARERRVARPSNATVRKDVVVVQAFHQWAVERDYPLRPVSTAVAPPAPRPSPKPVQDEIWRQLWTHNLSMHDRLWLGLGYYAGLRRAEIVSVRPHDIDLVEGTMTFIRKGGSPQPIEYREMFGAVADQLPHLVCDIDWVGLFEAEVLVRQKLEANFVWYDSTGVAETDANRLNKRLDRKLCPDVGIPVGSVTPHRLRHSCATNLLRAGVDEVLIMNALSHSDLSVTKRYMKTSGQLARWRQKGAG